jgi:hypothetical protein
MREPTDRNATNIAGLSSRGIPPLALCFFAAIGLAAYMNVIDTYFLSDDFDLIGRVLAGDLSAVWGREHGGFFRPVLILSYALDVALWGRRPVGFHLTNVGLHALNAFLVFSLAKRLLATGRLTPGRRDAAAIVAGLLFLLHPSHSEAVSWISGRADVLTTFFGLLSLLFYEPEPSEHRRVRLGLSVFCFALALMAKESAAFIPLAILLLGAFRHPGPTLRRRLAVGAKEAAPFLLTLAAYLVARFAALGTLIGGYGAERHLDLTHSTVVSQLLRFPLRVFFPAVVLRHAPFLESRLLSPVLIATGSFLLLVFVLAVLRSSARKTCVAFARRNGRLWILITLFFCALLPVISLRIEVLTTEGERYLYFPSVFFCIVLAEVLLRLVRGRGKAVIAVLFLLILYAVSLWETNRHWADAARLSRSIVDDLSSQTISESVLVLNIPDNLDGAYVFRNGLREALLWFSDEGRDTNVRVMAWHRLASANGGAELQLDDSGELRLILTAEGEEFGRINKLPEVELVEQSSRQLRLRFKDGTRAVDVFYFGGGRMMKVAGRN